jgi:hypothetical protein
MNRKRNQVSLLLLLSSVMVILLAGACSRKPTEYVGSVNDRYITYEEYMTARRNLFESFVLETGLTPDSSARKEIEDRAFNNLVEGIIFQQLLREYEITVTTSEVIDTLTDNIPEFIINSRQFNVDNDFNLQEYRTSLLESEPIDLSWLVRYYRNVYVPLEKLKQKILRNYLVDDQIIRNEYLVMNSSAEASIIFFDPEDFEGIRISNQEIRDYYTDNRAGFVREAFARLQFITFPLKPSAADSLKTKTEIDSVYTELEEGTPFAMLAGTVSDSQTTNNRGEMPFLEITDFPARIRTSLEQLQLNEYTRPFSVEDGWVIYQLIARTRNLVKLREIFVAHKASPQTREKLYDHIVNIRELATEIGLERTAYEFDLIWHETERVTPEEPFLPLLGKSDRIIDRAVNAQSGVIFEPVFHEQLQAYVLIQIMDSQRADYLPLPSVSDEIMDILTRRKQLEAARLRAEHYYRKFSYNRILAEAEKDGFPVSHFSSFTHNTSMEIADPLLLARAMFISGKERYITEPVVTNNGTFIVVIHKLNRADGRQITSEDREQLTTKILTARGDALFEEWLKVRIEGAKVRDWRQRR